jgi:carboxylesterase
LSNKNIASLGLFRGDEHKPFFWEGGEAAALFIHGFMGTPAEMRPLALEMQQAGFTTQGLLVPGFGPEIDRIFEHRYQDWLEATQSAIVDLRSHYDSVVLIGYSLGGAIALKTAVIEPPDSLVLLAPFWHVGRHMHQAIWQLFKLIFPNPRPFKRANFSDPRINGFVGGLAPELDLSDPAVLNNLQELRVPTRFVDQLLIAGKEAKRNAKKVHVPTLIVQGTDDKAVKTKHTRQLLQRMPGPIAYAELKADHALVEANNPGFKPMSQRVLDFTRELFIASIP